MKKKLAILSLSTVIGSATAITTVLPLMMLFFSDQSTARVETLVTVSSMSAVITILLNGYICKIIGIKKTILTGLIIGALFGVFPLFINDYYGMIVCRILLGIGIGLYSPHAISLISFFYKGSERSKLLGMQMGIGALGNAILLSISGWLALFGWQFSFLVYILLAVIAVLIWFFVPEVNLTQSTEVISNKKLGIKVWFYLILCLVTFIIIWGVQLKIPSYLIDNGIKSTEKAGSLLSTMNIAGMLAGFSFGFIFSKLRRFLLPLGYLGAAGSVLGLVYSNTWVSIFLFAVLFNFIYSFTGPSITVILNQLAKNEHITRVNSLLTMTTIVSSFAAPFIWNPLPGLFGMSENAQNSLLFMIISLLILGVILTVRSIFIKSDHS